MKLACIFELHRLRDCATALIERVPDLVPAEVSSLLRQPYDSVHADDGRPWGPNYHIFEELWRQRPYGYRDPTLSVPNSTTQEDRVGGEGTAAVEPSDEPGPRGMRRLFGRR